MPNKQQQLSSKSITHLINNLSIKFRKLKCPKLCGTENKLLPTSPKFHNGHWHDFAHIIDNKIIFCPAICNFMEHLMAPHKSPKQTVRINEELVLSNFEQDMLKNDMVDYTSSPERLIETIKDLGHELSVITTSAAEIVSAAKIKKEAYSELEKRYSSLKTTVETSLKPVFKAMSQTNINMIDVNVAITKAVNELNKFGVNL